MSLLHLAQQALQSGHLQVAIQQCLRLWHANSGHAEAAGLLAVLYARTGEPDKALEFAGHAIEARPDDSRLRFNRAAIRESVGDDAGAETDYEAACRLDGTNLAARINLGNLLLRNDRLADAEACFAAAATAFPLAAEAHEGLGIALQRQKRSAEALAALHRARALNPDHPRIDANLGWALLEGGEADGAAAQFDRALASCPGVSELWVGLAASHMARRAWPQALAALERALDIEPAHQRALAFKGVALDGLGRSAERRALIDLDRLVWRREHREPPEGYVDLGAFNQALADYVLAHPSLVHNRAGKTTRNGSQTTGLAETEPGPVAALARWIRGAIASYVAELRPAERAAAPRRWRLRIWGTVLTSGGHQDPHHHPSGWVSGVYYVRVPPGVGSDDTDQAGWIEFGRPDPFLRPVVVPDLRTVRPAEGLLLVFPSHVWHRTIPFVGDQPRISIAFDAVPMPP
ncbi:MAG TPA: putative 2OG-Fe(II) oxygenase [Alphaproteobacteria bacterium]|nr:putative 2OG-Fe(II) oxygenase [Alphaproteobacteria bacterium]